MADTPAEINKAKKLYALIGALLFVFTVITYLVATQSWLDFGEHGFDHVDAIIGIAIAAFKAGLVAFIFMHLNHEKKSIYWIFFGAIFFAVMLIILFALAFFDPIIFDGMMPEYSKG